MFSFSRDEDGVAVCLEPRADREQLKAFVPAEVVAEARKRAEHAEPELNRWWALDLLGCHLANCHPDSVYEWSEHRVGNGVPDFGLVHQEPELAGPSFEHTAHDSIRRVLIRDHGSVIIDGRTGSGKSALTALWAYRCTFAEAGRIDLDLFDASDGAESVMSALLTMPPREWYVVVMEKVTANLGKAQGVYNLVERLRRRHGYDIAVLANGWLDLANGSTIAGRLQLPRGTLKVRTEPTRVFNAMAAERSLDPQQVRAVRERCGGGEDLVLAHLALDYLKARQRVPTREEFTRHVAEHYRLTEMDDPGEREALYRFACLGANEIEVPASEIKIRFARYIQPFVRRQLIERADTTHRIGSRSVAREMARYACLHWTDRNGGPLPAPAKVAASTLRHAGPAQIQATLDRLDFISASRGDAPPTARLLANAWSRRDQIKRLMARAVEADAEWGDNAASAAFACMALRHLDLEEQWERCADWIRRRWSYDTLGELPIWVGSETAEKVDFQGMTESMSREDDRLERPWPPDLRGDRIDPDRAHRTWMLGVLLSFEGTAPRPDEDRISVLYETACAVQETSGAFYPARVPWITARVLIGLCLAGYQDSKVARDAALWLLRDSFNFGWKSGTGSWNTNIMTTAMCVIALLRQGVSATEHQIGVGLAALPTATRPSEIDMSLVVEAMLLGMNDRDARATAYDLLGELLVWASDEREWSAAGRPPPLNQPARSGGEGESTRLPFVVSQLLPCIWEMVVSELAAFFAEDFDRRSEPAPAAAGQRQPAQLPVPVPQSAALPDFGTVARARGRLDQIGRQLASDIESREKAARGRNQQKHLKFFRERIAELNVLRSVHEGCLAEFQHGPVTVDLIERIDRLGREVVGRSYEPVFEESGP